MATIAGPALSSQAAVALPVGDGDILATLRSLVEATNASRTESRAVLARVEEQGRRFDSFVGMLHDY